MVQTLVSPQGLSDALSAQLSPTTQLYTVAVPNTNITNRAQVVDFTRDLLPRLGVQRIMTQASSLVQGEYGPNGEPVFRPQNDFFNQIRFVGQIGNANQANGVSTYFNGTTDYAEICFYGTGLNMLVTAGDALSRSIQASVDGGALGSNLYPTASYSAVTEAGNWNANHPLKIVDGLTLGMHTVRIYSNGSFSINCYGFEIITNSGTSPNILQLVPGTTYSSGGIKHSIATLAVDSYNSNFESGSLGTTGGHVIVYQKSDGTIGKAVNPTGITPLYLINANHSNESVIRTVWLRELGNGKTVDLSGIPQGSNTANGYTLDDGTTSGGGTLLGWDQRSFGETLNIAIGGILRFTFVGTGLDMCGDFAQGAATIGTVAIDGVSVGSYVRSGAAAGSTVKICSGLPYGTHTVVITSSNNADYGNRFVVYGPSAPTLPTGAVQIGEYYVMANYVAGTGNQSGVISTGVLYKSPLRELTFVGANWTIGQSTAQYASSYVQSTNTSADNDYFTYTFWGTGFELLLSYLTTPVQATMTVDGVIQTTGVAVTNGGSYATGTGIITQANSGAQVQVTGLTLGTHTVKVSKHTTTDNLQVMGVNIITPIHTPKSNIPGDLQNTSPVGSNGMGDSRSFGSLAVKSQSNWVQAVGVVNGPTTSSTSPVPLPDMIIPLKTLGNPIEVFFTAELQNSGSTNNMVAEVHVDGVAHPVNAVSSAPGIGLNSPVLFSAILPVSAGMHVIQAFWYTNAGTLTAYSTCRLIKAREIT